MSHANRCRRSTAAFAICLLVACSTPEERFAEHLEKAGQLAEAGQAEEAALEYRSALKIDSESVEANEKLAELLLRRADLTATFYLTEAIRIDPGRVDIAMRLARVLLISNQTQDAERVIEASLKAHPNAAVIYSAKSELFLYKNDPEGALELALKAAEFDPDDPDVWMQIGRVHVGRMRMADLKKQPRETGVRLEAIAAFERADELAGGLVQAKIEQARLIGMRKEASGRARDVFIEAIDLAKEQGDEIQHFVAAQAAEDFAIRTRRPSMQSWAIREMLAADESRLDLWAKLARLFDDSNGFGVMVYKNLLEKRPDDVGAHLMFASYLARNDLKREAMEHLREVMDRDLGSPLPWEQLIRLQIQAGRVANARATFVRMSDEFPDDPITKRTEARIALAEGRTDDASRILQGLTTESENFEYLRLLALTEHRNGNLEGAADTIDRALALRRDFAPDAMRLKARIHHDLNEWAAALRALTAVANRGYSMSDGELIIRARALYGIDRPEKGREVLEQILTQEKPPSVAVIEYARREGSAHPKEATVHLNRALAREPTNPEVIEALVGLDLRAGRAPLALVRINNAIETGRAKPETLLLRAQVLTKTGDLDRAEADALRAFEADPSLVGGVDLLYAIYRAQGRLDEARASFEEAEAARVLHSGARLLLSRIYLRQGEMNRAQQMLEKILRDDSNSSAAKTDLAYLLAANGRDLDRALRLAEEAQQSMSRDPDAANTVGYVYLRKGLNEAALQQFQYALELNGERTSALAPTLHYHLGLSLDALDRNEEAADAFEKALVLDANFPGAEDARRRIERAQRMKVGAASTS